MLVRVHACWKEEFFNNKDTACFIVDNKFEWFELFKMLTLTGRLTKFEFVAHGFKSAGHGIPSTPRSVWNSLNTHRLSLVRND